MEARGFIHVSFTNALNHYCKQNRPLCEGCDRANSLMCYSYSSEVRTAEKRQPYLMEQHPAWLFFCAGAESGG